MSQSFADFRREPSQSHQCMHYDDDGRRCRSHAMHNEFFCYTHRISPVQPVIENEPFEITHLNDRIAIQQALANVAARLAANRMDLKRAGLLAYTLQVAAVNLGADTVNLGADRLPETSPASGNPPAPTLDSE